MVTIPGQTTLAWERAGKPVVLSRSFAGLGQAASAVCAWVAVRAELAGCLPQLLGTGGGWVQFGWVEIVSLTFYLVSIGVLWTLARKKVRQCNREREAAQARIKAVEQELDRCHEIERDLRKTSKQYEIFFSANPHPMWVYDEETLQFIAVNDAAVKNYGYSREEFLTMTIRDIRPPEDVPLLEQRLRQQTQRPARSSGIWRHRTKNGCLMDVSITSHKLALAGRPARLVLAFDVTSEQHYKKALLREKERFELLSEAAGALLFADEPPAVVHQLYEKLARHSGVDLYLNFMLAEDRQSFRLCSSAGIPPEMAQRLSSVTFEQLLCCNAVRAGKPLIMKDIQECGDPRASLMRSLGIHAYSCYPLQTEGRLLGVLAFGSRSKPEFSAEDLELFRTLCRYLALAKDRLYLLQEARAHSAQLEAADERLRQHAAELERAVEERTAFLQQSLRSLEGVLYHVAHDLRAPLRAIHGFAQLLSQEYAEQLDEQAHAYARKLTESARRMDQLIHDLLVFGRLGHQHVALRPVDLSGVLDRILDEFQPEIAAKHAEMVVVPPFPPVLAEPELAQLCVENLLSNTLKFVAPETPPRVRLWAETTSDQVRFYVQDQGVGIEPEYLHRIFGIFERLHPEQDIPGTGIGLAIVKKAMERMGGEVSVQSQLGQGSKFCLHFKHVNNL